MDVVGEAPLESRSGGGALAVGEGVGDHPSAGSGRRWQKKVYPGEVFPLPKIFVEPAPRRWQQLAPQLPKSGILHGLHGLQ